MPDLRDELRERFRDKEYRQIYTESFQNSWIASQIKALREQRQMTQAQLAEAAQMMQARISVLEDVNYESWNVNTLRRLANALDVDLHVRFVPYSKTVVDADNFGITSLHVPSFDEDAFFDADTSVAEQVVTVSDIPKIPPSGEPSGTAFGIASNPNHTTAFSRYHVFSEDVSSEGLLKVGT